jgi:hypothetical protein
MPRPYSLATLLIFLTAAWTSAQEASPPEIPNPIDSFLRLAGSTRQLGVPEPLEPAPSVLDPDTEPRPFLKRIEFHPHAELTNLLKLNERGFGITDLEGQLAITIPLGEGIAPLKIVPGAAMRWWNGPTAAVGVGQPDLPSRVYDFYADIGWRPRPAKWLFIDFKVTPGFYSDLENTSHGAFRPRGQGLAIIALSEQFQIVAGVVYANRVRTKVVPAGGIRWAPNDDTEFRLVFPAPRISHRICTWRETSFKLYLAGEFGGGAWAVRRDDGQNDVVDYSDLRLLSGLEAALPDNRRWYAEFGYVFNRRIDYASGVTSTFGPSDTVLFRAGFTY